MSTSLEEINRIALRHFEDWLKRDLDARAACPICSHPEKHTKKERLLHQIENWVAAGAPTYLGGEE